MTPEERLAKLEQHKEDVDEDIRIAMTDIGKIRSIVSKIPLDVNKAVEKEVNKVCAKLTSCQTERDNYRKGARENMKTDLEMMGKNMDRMWGMTWKFMLGVLAIMVTLAGWNFNTASKVAKIEENIHTVTKRMDQRNEVDRRLVNILDRLDNKLAKGGY